MEDMRQDLAPHAPTAVPDSLLRRYDHPVLFYGLSTAIPWVLWLTAGWLSHRPAPPGVLIAVLGVTGLLAPLGVAVALISRQPALVLDTRRRLLDLRAVPARYWLLAAFLMPASLMVATGVSVALGHSPEQFLLRGGVSFTAGIVPGWIALTLAPVVEELAWHGYGTDALAARWSIWRTSMVFAVIWAVWHLPLGTIEGYYQAEVVQTGPMAVVNFLGSIFPFVVLMNWIYYRSGRNILVAVVFHLMANIGNEVFLTHPDTKTLQTMLVVLVSGVVLWRERALFFTRPEARARSTAAAA